MRAFICGCEGTTLTAAEKKFFRDADPWGLILFARNIDTADQIRRLVGEFRECVGRDDALVLVDQEGGRVQRILPPIVERHPAAMLYGVLYNRDPMMGAVAAGLGARLLGAELHALGINVACLPVLDIPQEGAHDIIGDRAYGRETTSVATLGRAVAEGLLASGVLPVVKHIPGHGRASEDSHEHLPVVDSPIFALGMNDFAPFIALSDMPLAMTAHIIYSAIDPDRPATLSPLMISEIIRGRIGFDGILMTDDLSMKALKGPMRERAASALIAGCDIALHCYGNMEEMEEVAEGVPVLSGQTARRAERAMAFLDDPEPFDEDAARRLVQTLVAATAS